LRNELAGGDRRAGLAPEHFLSSLRARGASRRAGSRGQAFAATIKELERRGHIVEVDADWSEGRLTAASRDGRRRRAAANPRGMQGYAAGR
jgi:gamma-glutamyltranspeptidase/glutathione hydrolase